MARPTRTLIGMITDQATNTYEGETIDMENFEKWEEHWFETAGKIRDEFDKEGLTQTVDKIDDIIVGQRRISDSFREREAKRKARIRDLLND